MGGTKVNKLTITKAKIKTNGEGCLFVPWVCYNRKMKKIRPQKILSDLEKNVYCMLRPSKVHGVGVFAIRDIPKDTNPFKGTRKVVWTAYPRKEFEKNKKIPKEVRELVKALCLVEKDTVYLPDHSLNAVDVSYFLNHSKRSNMKPARGATMFITKRRIKKGEELTFDYKKINDESVS